MLDLCELDRIGEPHLHNTPNSLPPSIDLTTRRLCEPRTCSLTLLEEYSLPTNVRFLRETTWPPHDIYMERLLLHFIVMATEPFQLTRFSAED